MNTLSPQYTRKFFSSASDYIVFRQHWSKLINSGRKHELKAVHHLIYLVLCGKDWRKAFTFPTNHNKLNNGYRPELYHTLFQFHSSYLEEQILSSFDGLVSHEAILEARRLLQVPKVAGGNYLTDAYIPQELTLPGD